MNAMNTNINNIAISYKVNANLAKYLLSVLKKLKHRKIYP